MKSQNKQPQLQLSASYNMPPIANLRQQIGRNFLMDETSMTKKSQINKVEQQLKSKVRLWRNKNNLQKRIEKADCQVVCELDMSLRLGYRNDRNQVLQQNDQFLYDQVQNEEQNMNSFQKLLNYQEKRQAQGFILKKMEQKQRDKQKQKLSPVQRLKSKLDKSFKKNFSLRSKTLPSVILPKKHDILNRLPRQVAQLHQKIRKLPVIKKNLNHRSNKLKSQGSQIPENQSNLFNLSTSQNLFNKKTNNLKTLSLKQSIEIITKKAGDALQEPTASKDKKKQRLSFKNYCSYWPTHDRFMTQANQKNTRNCYQDIQLFTLQREDYRKILELMRKRFRLQQSNMLKESFQYERKSFDGRFKQILAIEKANQKLSARQLLKVKKEFLIQSNREEIKANGIKRSKRINYVTIKNIYGQQKKIQTL